MDLRERLDFPITELQRRMGASSYSTLHQVLAGIKPCSPGYAKRIEAATSGAIRWTEFFDDPPAHQPPPLGEAV
nr:hypothetical protein [uncultured Holophaga sp.]